MTPKDHSFFGPPRMTPKDHNCFALQSWWDTLQHKFAVSAISLMKACVGTIEAVLLCCAEALQIYRKECEGLLLMLIHG